MKVIHARNVHEALPEALYQMRAFGVKQESRNGPVWVVDEPVTTVYHEPCERVLLWPERDANPFFHFYEGLWMLGGCRDVASLTRFVQTMSQFSDDGQTFHGAYGWRWRRAWGMDQLAPIAQALAKDKTDRRQVLQIWNPTWDLEDQAGKRDLPCNLTVHFQVRGNRLDMTVFNRSNDIIWGCYGANAVHFSMLQEVMAAWVGVGVGKYWQVSDNWHAYETTFLPLLPLADRACPNPLSYGRRTPYEGEVAPYPMVNRSIDTWMSDLHMFLTEGHQAIGYSDPFFRRVALPIVETHALFKNREFRRASAACENIEASDWRKAIREWLQRREAKRGQNQSTS